MANVNGAEKEITAIVPFENQTNANGQPTLQCSDPINLSIATSTNTVSIEFNDFFIPNNAIITIEPLGTFSEKSLTRTNLDSYMAGLIEALLDMLDPDIATKRYSTDLVNLIRTYIAAAREKLHEHEQTIISRTKETLTAPIRAEGIALFDDIAVFITQWFKGSLLVSSHPNQKKFERLCQERNLFSVVTSHNDLLAATIEAQLARWGQADETPADAFLSGSHHSTFGGQVDGTPQHAEKEKTAPAPH